MEIAEDMRILTNKIIDAYEVRVKMVTGLISRVNELLRNFRWEQENMVSRLKEILAKKECLRKKDFEAMMQPIQEGQMEKEKEVDQMLKKTCQEEKEMITELRAILASNGQVRVKDFIKMVKENILIRQKGREKEVSKMLRSLHQEQEELNSALRKLLSKGDSVRIRDFKAMIKAFQVQRSEQNGEIGQLLKEFRKVYKEISAEWEKVINAKEGGSLALERRDEKTWIYTQAKSEA